MKKLKETRAFRKTKRFLKQISGEDVFTKASLKCPKAVFPGDWGVCPTGLSSSSIVYSFGVGDDISFDKALIETYGLHVFAFDPTPASISWVKTQPLPENFHFYPYGISNKTGSLKLFPRARKKGRSSSMFTLVQEGGGEDSFVEVPVYCIKDIMKMLSHDRIDICKMDIEGSEYEVIDDVIDANIDIYQLLIEFHHRFETIPKQKTVDTIAKLRSNGFEIFYISDLGREYSFLHTPSYRQV